MPVPAVAELDALPPSEAAAALAPLFEAAPRFVARLVAARPFTNESDLFDRAREIALALPEDEAIELVDAHPRLGAPPATLSGSSRREQGHDGAATDADDAGGALAERLERLNTAYEARYGFRYCVFVAGRPRDALIPEWEEHLASNDRAAELRRALGDVVAIGRDRYRRARGGARAEDRVRTEDGVHADDGTRAKETG
ncbi:MAG TPA: 2-oxo-4-hydroxy-4-carboxy-5-ureidoimidazoline decarboxylase [Candidatus Limnocylindrales bacterium]|nr:2-oxo-4-hydroxy-4-carboxy-5-ureidoimidazoline decarboxylase [Candidatus Limnocylindrales bacterium]